MRFISLTSVENNLSIDPSIDVNPDKIYRVVRVMKDDSNPEHTQIWYGSFTNEGYEAVQRVQETPWRIRELVRTASQNESVNVNVASLPEE